MRTSTAARRHSPFGKHVPIRCLPVEGLEARGRRGTHPCSQAAASPVVTVLPLEARARAVVLLLHEPVVQSLPRQTRVHYETAAWKQSGASLLSAEFVHLQKDTRDSGESPEWTTERTCMESEARGERALLPSGLSLGLQIAAVGEKDKRKTRQTQNNEIVLLESVAAAGGRSVAVVLWGLAELSPCLECSLPISIHRGGVENHQKNIIQRRKCRKEKEPGGRYPDRGEPVRAAWAQSVDWRNHSVWSTDQSAHTQTHAPLPASTFTVNWWDAKNYETEWPTIVNLGRRKKIWLY